MSDQSRGRPVLKRVEDGGQVTDEDIAAGSVWFFCGEYEGTERAAVDTAHGRIGDGIYKVFPSGSWAGGYLRD